MEIIKPEEKYFLEYFNACKESYENNIEEWMPFNPENYDVWKEHILETYDNYEKGENIPEGMPRVYTYWCVENNTFIGEIQLRPYLTYEEATKWGHISYAVRYSQWGRGNGTKLLKTAIDKLHKFQVTDVYVACHKSNDASIRVIEKNAGIYVKTIVDEEGIEENVYLVK